MQYFCVGRLLYDGPSTNNRFERLSSFSVHFAAFLDEHPWVLENKPAPQKMLDLSIIEPDILSAKSSREQISPESTLALASANTPKPTTVDDVDISHRQHAKLLMQTLQLVFASEVLVFAEYAEFVCSVLYGLYTLILHHMPYAKYNLTFIGVSDANFWLATSNCAIYMAFEAFTMAFLFTLVRAKYGLSTLYQLAFVLEKYWMSVEGKLVGSLALIFILNTVHQGTDLSLHFDWQKVLDGTSGI